MAEFNNKIPFVLKEMQDWVTTKISDAKTIIEEWCSGRFSLNTHNHDAKYDSKGSASAVQTNLNTHDNNTTKHITASERTKWNSKADGSHTHTTSQVSGLDTALARKVDSSTFEAHKNDTKAHLYAVSGIYTCTGDQHDSYIFINHGESSAPIMVFACMMYYPYASATGLDIVNLPAGVPTNKRNMSTTHIWFLIPHTTTTSNTTIRWTAIFGSTK